MQYAYLPQPLALRAFQTPFASRPWAAEMPSAGRVLTADRLAGLRRAGIGLREPHARGRPVLDGDRALDALLPLPEPYDVPAATARAVNETRVRGGRVIAAGTTVVRALESASGPDGVGSGPGIARLHVDGAHALRSVDAILTGMHEPGSSHFELLSAFVPPALLAEAHERAESLTTWPTSSGISMLVLPAR